VNAALYGLRSPTKNKEILMIGSLMMRVSVVILLIGMLGGIDMGIRQDFALGPAHAHFNLVGGVLLFLFGLYYRLVPEAGASGLAKVQGWLHMVGAIVFPVGVGLVITKGESLVAIPIIGSLVVVVAVALFAVIVFRTTT
jgi:peptidoglycan/LPS O-acetylase OafA/YrhL